MFDIGWSELLVVLIVALVVVGPKDLPRLMRTIGQWVGKARSMADQFRKSFDEMTREAELDDLRAEITALRAVNPLADVEAELNRPVLPPEAEKPAAAPDEPAATPDEAGAVPKTDAAPKTDTAPPAAAVGAAEVPAKAGGDDSGVPGTPAPPGSDPPAP